MLTKAVTSTGVVLFTLLAGAALATPQFMQVFDKTYKPKAGTALQKARCAVCHISKSGGGKLNLYGQALKGKPAKAASLRAIEKLDSDKDRFTNLKEIKAGTLPGDPKSKPAAKAKPAAKRSVTTQKRKTVSPPGTRPVKR